MEVRIHAKLAIKVLEVPALKLWYLARALDLNGSGRAVVSAKEVKELCRRGNTTTWRYLNDRRLFHTYRYDRKLKSYVIMYRSLPAVCAELRVRGLGGIGWSDTVDNLAVQAAHIEAIKIQQQSMYLAELSDPNALIIKPELYFDSEGNPLSDIFPGSRAARKNKIKGYFEFNGQKVALLSSTPATYGASINGVAKSLNISWSCAQGLLSNVKEKLQVAQRVSWKYWHRAVFEASENFGSPLESGFFAPKQIKLPDGERCGRLPLKMLPYRYYPAYVLCSQRHLRARAALPEGVSC